MSFTFGRLPEHTVTDARGTVVSGASLDLYGTEADATAGSNALSSVVTDSRGRWSFADPTRPVIWVRPRGGLDTYPVEAPESNGASGAALVAANAAMDKANSALLLAGKVTHGALSFSVKDFGAVGDGVTDDTAAIRSCVTAAFNAANASPVHYAEILFDAAVYLVNGAPMTGSGTDGNAIIPLPLQAPTAAKITLVFKGPAPVDALPLWRQTVPHVVGTTLKTTRTDGTNDPVNGPASVVGGPTVKRGYGTGPDTPWNNMHIVIEGISINVPVDPTYCGFDFQGMAAATVTNGSAFSNQAPAQPGFTTTISHSWTYGLAMPVYGNNALSNVGSWSCEGFCYGFMPTEHTVAVSVRCIYCTVGIEFYSGDGKLSMHTASIQAACIEACDVGLGVYPAGAVKFKIGLFDVESLGRLIYDPNNLGIGEIYKTGDGTDFGYYPPSGFVGGRYMRIIDGGQPAGAVTAPAIPATTAALMNPFLRDAAVIVSGGTVSAIKVDGVNLKVTSGLVMVPTMRTIELTYTVAPTWVWTLL